MIMIYLLASREESKSPKGCGNIFSTVNDYHSHLIDTPPHPVGQRLVLSMNT